MLRTLVFSHFPVLRFKVVLLYLESSNIIYYLTVVERVITLMVRIDVSVCLKAPVYH